MDVTDDLHQQEFAYKPRLNDFISNRLDVRFKYCSPLERALNVNRDLLVQGQYNGGVQVHTVLHCTLFHHPGGIPDKYPMRTRDGFLSNELQRYFVPPWVL